MSALFYLKNLLITVMTFVPGKASAKYNYQS